MNETDCITLPRCVSPQCLEVELLNIGEKNLYQEI